MSKTSVAKRSRSSPRRSCTLSSSQTSYPSSWELGSGELCLKLPERKDILRSYALLQSCPSSLTAHTVVRMGSGSGRKKEEGGQTCTSAVRDSVFSTHTVFRTFLPFPRSALCLKVLLLRLNPPPQCLHAYYVQYCTHHTVPNLSFSSSIFSCAPQPYPA